ncbi:MAG TPA: Brp/Blh family beta-carotene 15,15'-dioxygenase [Phaeodactylibacter sp.]|nr:Brp/Blh family beta-carotene 15,15'-dioxygenase [Phaeodactylibacter sp.]
MTARYPILYRTVQALAVAAVLLSLALPGLVLQVQLLLVVGMILFIGIPHGATDYLIFQSLSQPMWGSREMTHFYFNYVLLMVAYALLWWLIPAAALVVFIAISIYHFGQSNWNYATFSSKWSAYAAYMLWGSFVLLVPIIWHYGSAMLIIESIIGAAVPEIAKPWREAFCISLFVANLWLTLYYFLQQRISRRAFMDEVVNLFVLALLLINVPLLLAFTIYFVCWHSLSSMMDQIRFFRKRQSTYSLQDYMKNALPLSGVAIASLGVFAFAQAKMQLPVNIGLVFIFISVVTLPHMLLIDRLYEEEDNQKRLEPVLANKN